MHDELIKLGRHLRTKREEMRLSLKEVESSTSIRMNLIEAIEEGKDDVGLSEVYRFGFIRQYASFLGLDMKELESKYPALFQNCQEKHEFDYGIGTLERRTSGSPSGRLIPNILWSGGIGLMLLLAWQLAKYLQVL